jgi:alpha-tubulin suppressor-like RCC1 family protein
MSGHACALSTAGAMFCWGGNTFGQIGLGSTGGDHLSPAVIAMPQPQS